ncbi:hypothetical protein SARC_13660 [Sphaeroforma arctica JP610]|uniref:FAD dependent oxidoreductase domain-containing protein n=1 Tax=Sphaeroforma arctica JP610 TaxID=667725 RepID=A0A0L0FCH7_9EUKA|nr:hypothetical protein SARC_13660 [Sphaeroforma arctica JP610]KNC73783.1 hypothetical protein SARC_13660 [Sphaeroforma arctica JP610]|eukprot:XP_014147685.1 hypothetical protein SARC_13660 [Sphaeroforma arctica JP610]
MGVKFRAGVYVQGVLLHGDHNEQVRGLQTSEGVIEFDPATTDVVVAAGSWTPLLLRKLGLYVPVYPMKGYSLLTDLGDIEASPSQLHLPRGVVVDGPVWSVKYHNELRVTSIGKTSGRGGKTGHPFNYILGEVVRSCVSPREVT